MPGPDVWEVVLLDVIALAIIIFIRILIALYVPPPYSFEVLSKDATWLQKLHYKLRKMTHKKVRPEGRMSSIRKQYLAEAVSRRSEERDRIILDEKLDAETAEQLEKDKEEYNRATAARKEEERLKKEEKKLAKASEKQEKKGGKRKGEGVGEGEGGV